MVVQTADQSIVCWARTHGFPYYCTPDVETGEDCLKVHLGHVTAYFRDGKLVRLWVQAEGAFLDEAFAQLAQLFSLCVQLGSYVEQETVAWPVVEWGRAVVSKRPS